MTAWIRKVVPSAIWHAERADQPWQTRCGRHLSPEGDTARVESDEPPFDSQLVCATCMQIMYREMREEKP